MRSVESGTRRRRSTARRPDRGTGRGAGAGFWEALPARPRRPSRPHLLLQHHHQIFYLILIFFPVFALLIIAANIFNDTNPSSPVILGFAFLLTTSHK